ncbi:MAG: family N-acetyltransferase, partial [Acidobacteria bacterium]|nr:family N-acetyltransferase [Acidobacteriota bacterium]
MATYPIDYDFHVVLRDGGLAHIRPVKPEDADALHAMFHRLGRESVYHRFFRHKADVVEDGHQGRGIATQLLIHLTNYARNNGVTSFRAFVLPDNYPMMRVFRSSGFQLHREMGQGI